MKFSTIITALTTLSMTCDAANLVRMRTGGQYKSLNDGGDEQRNAKWLSSTEEDTFRRLAVSMSMSMSMPMGDTDGTMTGGGGGDETGDEADVTTRGTSG